MQTMSQRIQEARKRRGLSLTALAKCSGVPASTLSIIERDKRPADGLTVASAKKLAIALGVSIDYLAGTFEEQPHDAAP